MSDSDFKSQFPHVVPPHDAIQGVDAAPSPKVSFQHVTITLNDRRILSDVGFTLERGQTLCILGRSGVGKSVTLRILMGFLRPEVGSIWIDDTELNLLDEDGWNEIRKRITMVFQNGALFDSLTVFENVAFPLRERGGLNDEQVEHVVGPLLEMVGALDVRNDLPSSLSTGRRRAVAIARALASQPEIVLYDEPTTMVDPLIARRLGDIILRLKRQLGITSIVVTHDMRFAERMADTVLFLHEGQAAYFGPLSGFIESQLPEIRQFLEFDAYVIPSA